MRRLREEAGYSQEAFADKAKVHRTYMGTVERGDKSHAGQHREARGCLRPEDVATSEGNGRRLNLCQQ
ncbi:MAG TPA: helix-turn-helix transcriptional regulator [Gemmatimonadaceae bacterium]